MKAKRWIIYGLLPALLLFCAAVAISQEYIEARIFIDSFERFITLQTMHLDMVWMGKDYIDIVTNTRELRKIESLGFHVEIIHEDLVQFYRIRFPDINQSGYLSLSQIQTELSALSVSYPDLITPMISIGQTIEGRDIAAVKISDNPSVDEEDEPDILYSSAIHAREGITPLVLLHFMHYLLENYGTDSIATYLINNREMWFIPVINPDGYYYNDTTSPGGGGMWRKNRRFNGDGTFGVDLNRNFGYMWGYDDIGSSPITEDETYRGTAPFSEPETQAIRDFIINHEFIITVYYHSYSNMTLWPWDYAEDLYTPDENIYSAIGNTINSMNGYLGGQPWALLDVVNGGSDDWGYGEQTLKNKDFSLSIEVGSQIDGFWPPTQKINQLTEENLPVNLYLANLAGDIYSALKPEPPILTCPDTVSSDSGIILSWVHNDTLNPAVVYELLELQNFAIITHLCDNFDWMDNNGFYLLTLCHSEPKSFCAGSTEDTRTVQTSFPYTVQPGDTLRFWTYYDIQENYDYAYVEVSTDGEYFTPITGNMTTDFQDQWGHNRGHGITGTCLEWTEALFDLSEFVGQSLYFRFYYKNYSWFTHGLGIWIDDIYPISGYEIISLDSTDITDTTITLEGRSEGIYYYWIRARDGDGQWSPWSDIKQVVVRPSFVCGDANGDETVNILDITCLINYLYKGGPAPEPAEAADVNDSGTTNILDATYLIAYLYKDGPEPTCP